jgi:hypothetical protein
MQNARAYHAEDPEMTGSVRRFVVSESTISAMITTPARSDQTNQVRTEELNLEHGYG